MNASEPRETEKEDNESLLEKCWEERYKGDSKQWLIRDALTKKPRAALCSTMKESYLYPERKRADGWNSGKRRNFLMKKFYEEASEEILKEREITAEPADYRTEYDGNFDAEGFKPEDEFYKKNTELFQKYPLYSSAPVSYYSYNQLKNPKEVLHGLTRVTDRLNIFKRNGQFSKPITESLDFVEL